jgi:predicted ATPase
MGRLCCPAHTVAEDLISNMGPDRSPDEILRQFLADKHLLLILDNMEHLLEAAPMASRLLAGAPKLSILATSPEGLHISGEQEYLIQPLRTPEFEAHEGEEDLLAYDSVNLFVQRARSAEPTFSLQDGQAGAIGRICAVLDGLPLAIELAASQARILPPPMLAERLTEGADALPPGARDLPERQRTLRATIEWSYHLPGSSEKVLFSRLSAFRGGGTLEAIGRICGHELNGGPTRILAGLVEKSLVIPREGHDGELRFHMLVTMRTFAREQLQAAG